MIYVNSITIYPSNVTLTKGKWYYGAYAEICPLDATCKCVTWHSSNPEVASVNEYGYICGVSAGAAVIYATAQDGSGAVGFCNVTVNAPIMVNSVVVTPETKTANVGEKFGLSATVYPANAEDRRIRWTSCDYSVADVDDVTGCVTAKSPGTTCICANAIDGSGVYGCCEVTVNANIDNDNDGSDDVSAYGLKATTACRVRTDTVISDDTILKNSSGSNVVLQKDNEVYLLSDDKIIGGSYTSDSSTRNDWYRILYDGMMMYVTADSFDKITLPAPETPSGREVTVNTGGVNLNIRPTPSTDKSEIGKFANGTVVRLTNATPQNENWYAVYGQTTDGIYSYGWCSGEYLGNYVEYGTLVDVDTLNVRSGAGTGYTSIGTISKGGAVEILEKNCTTGSGYTWHKILYNGSIGYVVAGNNTPNFTFETRWVTLDTWSSSTLTYSFSSNGVTMLKSLEGFRPTAYIASSSESLYTIGYGHVITDGTKSVTINNDTYSTLTEELATTLLLQDLNNTFIPRFNIFLEENEIVLNQNQYDACIMDCFQKGQNIWSKQERLIAKFIFENQYFDNYDKVLTAFLDRTTNVGLTNRRTKEANLFVYGTYS